MAAATRHSRSLPASPGLPRHGKAHQLSSKTAPDPPPPSAASSHTTMATATAPQNDSSGLAPFLQRTTPLAFPRCSCPQPEDCGFPSGVMNITKSIQTSQAEVFFRRLPDEPAAAFAQLSALVQEKMEENEWMDFKEAAFIDAPLPSPDKDSGRPRAKEQGKRAEDVKRLWSENLSSFANSSGGVLIWGIRTERE